MVTSIVMAVVIVWLLANVVDFARYLADEGMFWRPVTLLACVGWGLWHIAGL